MDEETPPPAKRPHRAFGELDVNITYNCHEVESTQVCKVRCAVVAKERRAQNH